MELQRKLSEQEKEILGDFERAFLLKEMTMHPGWAVAMDLMECQVREVKDQYMSMTRVDKDALWAAHIRQEGIVQFAQCFKEIIEHTAENTSPETVKRVIESIVMNPADLEGDVQNQLDD